MWRNYLINYVVLAELELVFFTLPLWCENLLAVNAKKRRPQLLSWQNGFCKSCLLPLVRRHENTFFTSVVQEYAKSSVIFFKLFVSVGKAGNCWLTAEILQLWDFSTAVYFKTWMFFFQQNNLWWWRERIAWINCPIRQDTWGAAKETGVV